jgi:putative ABC transport system substrate-binding protein
MNSRRKLVIALGAGALAAPFGSMAQQPGKVWRIGVLAQRRVDFNDSDYIYGPFRKRMREFGYVDGKNLVIEWRSAEGKSERLPGLATELVQLNVDLIVTAGNSAVAAAQKATTTIPIVIGNGTDPVGAGFVASLAKPGGNITGLSNIVDDISPKYLEMLVGMVPNLSRAAILLDGSSPFLTKTKVLNNVRAAAKAAKVTVLPYEVRSPEEIEKTFSLMKKDKAEAVIVVSTGLFVQQARQIAELAAKHRVPSISGYREYADAGVMMSYGPSFAENYRRIATYVDKIFKGAKPGDLPVEQPTKFELIINGKTAKTLGLKIPQSLLVMADKVIE